MKKRGSWSLLAEMAGDMINSLELGDTAADYDDGPTSTPTFRPNKSQVQSLPSIGGGGGRSTSMAVPTKGALVRGLFSSDDDDYDPSNSNIDLKAHARQQYQRRKSKEESMFASISLPLSRKNSNGTETTQRKKDPLLDFHERHNKAAQEHKRQEEAKKRRQQLRDMDDEKSLTSSNSFFDFLTRSGAADELMTVDGSTVASGGGASAASTKEGDKTNASTNYNTITGTISNGMKRVGSTNSMASFFSLFGDDEEEIAKQSAAASANDTQQKQQTDPTLSEAVRQSKSVKGQRVFTRGKQAAQCSDWKKAVAYYHIALVKQRKYYGEDHIITSNTLNELGVALMQLGEHFGALTALEEALHIRQELLGAGAEEVAETTSNIWQVLKASQDDC